MTYSLALTLVSFVPLIFGRFNDNYIIRSLSINEDYYVQSTPYYCADENIGCVQVLDKTTQKPIYSFQVKRLIGCVYAGTNDRNTILKIPIGIGLTPLITIKETSSKPDQYIKIYKYGIIHDSIRIPAIYPTTSNKSFFFTKKKLDRSKLLHYKNDTLAVVTHRGVALLACHNGIISSSFTTNFNHLKSFKILRLDARIFCFPYPQPSSCEELSVIKK